MFLDKDGKIKKAEKKDLLKFKPGDSRDFALAIEDEKRGKVLSLSFSESSIKLEKFGGLNAYGNPKLWRNSGD